MEAFSWHIPTRILFGKGKIKELKENIPLCYEKIIIVTDKNSGGKSGALKSVVSQLDRRIAGIYDSVCENPSFDVLEEGKKLAMELKADMIIGIGGGSAMDSAKGIAVLATNPNDMKEYMKGRQLVRDPLPVVCISTTSGTGSEVTPYAVFSDHEDQSKGGFSHEKIFPVLSVVDPELTYSMPRELIINTGLDALTHAIEAYLCTNTFRINDEIALMTIKTIVEHLAKASEKDQDAMNQMAFASLSAGINITLSGTVLLHIMGYPLTVFHRIPHGKANAILLPEFIEYMEEKSSVISKIQIIKSLFASHGGIRNFIEQFGISTKLSTYGIAGDELLVFAEKTIIKSDIQVTPADVTLQDIRLIYEKSF